MSPKKLIELLERHAEHQPEKVEVVVKGRHLDIVDVSVGLDGTLLVRTATKTFDED